MAFSKFILIIGLVYVAYYSVVLIVDLLKGGAGKKGIDDNTYSIDDFEDEGEQPVMVRESGTEKKKIMADS